jgi:steroid delta-isomerase-like uncharacterized protein
MIIVGSGLSEGNKEDNMTTLETARLWIQGMDEHDVNKMFNLCTEDLFGEEIADAHPNIGRKAVAESYVDLFEGFPDCTSQIVNEFAGNDQVLIEVRWMGTNTGPFRGTPATDKAVDCRIAYIFMFNGDKICRITEYYDGATVAAQLS